MSHQTLVDFVRSINRIRTAFYWCNSGIRLFRSLIIATMAIVVWNLIRPEDELVQLGLGLWTFILCFFFSLDKSTKASISPKELAFSLEIKHGQQINTPLNTELLNTDLPQEWLAPFEQHKKAVFQIEKKRLWAMVSTLFIPFAVSILAIKQGSPSFKTAIREVTGVVSRLSRGASLKVISGFASKSDSDKTNFILSDENPPKIELISENLVEIQVTDGSLGTEYPVVFLKKIAFDRNEDPSANSLDQTKQTQAHHTPTEKEIYQSFQLLPVRDAVLEGEALGRYRLAFAANESVGVFIPSFAGEKLLATILVRQPPIPKVKLEVMGRLEEPWPDDQPLPLKIKINAENPIQTVHLIVKSGSRTSKELVANVVSENKLELDTDYRLILESYVESDLAQVEIIAEAADRSIPLPLVGYSNPIKLNTASAYGRYRETLKTLRNLKAFIDDALNKGEIHLTQEALKLADKASNQSEKSPFFDGLDRVQIYRFNSSIKEHIESPSTENLLELSGSLNDFLFEHEILDDRERDRDFFVAMRNLSRLIEQDPSKRSVTVRTVSERTRKFLDDRYARWTRRIERLGQAQAPELWTTIREKKPFHQAMHAIDNLDSNKKPLPDRTAEMLTILSKTAVEYRTWIEELESREDKAREAEEKARQEGLANARDALRELQQRQGEISQGLDRSNERPRGHIAADWPTLRMKQNTNAKDTKKLESQMRSLSPSSAARIEAALTAMTETMNAGDVDNFEVAETASDLAGRLLRQAESAAQDSQQKRPNRGRRRRVTGDSYYGQSVVGGDVEIKREYQVDRKYREDILDEVQNSEYDEENRALLERYLRHVVR